MHQDSIYDGLHLPGSFLFCVFSYNRSRFHDLAKTIRMPKWRRRARTRCLGGGAWRVEAALRIREIPEALEGLGTAAWWLDLADLVFDSRERAYRLYLALGDRAGAARVGVWLAWDYWAFRGETVVANGWLQRARRLLHDLPPCPERAWLEVREGSLCLLEEGDPARALALAAEVYESRRRQGASILRCWAGPFRASRW